MMTKKLRIALACILLAGAIFFLLFSLRNACEPSENAWCVHIGGDIVRAELAISGAEQSHGLSGREALRKGEGMLFVFERPGRHAFWMKDMKFAIDIIWIAEDMRVVHIEKNVSPDSYPQTFTSELPAQYVLEVPAGFADKHDVASGAEVLFTK